jgi:hypothetical protein
MDPPYRHHQSGLALRLSGIQNVLLKGHSGFVTKEQSIKFMIFAANPMELPAKSN